MSSESAITHITPAGGNVFADLGFNPDDAARFLAETDAAILAKQVAAEPLTSKPPAAQRVTPKDKKL